MKEPKIRFKGFSGEWKDLPFSEIVERTSSTGKTGSLPGIEFEDIVSGEGCLNKDVYQKDCRKYGKIFREGDILFGKLRPYLKNILLAEFRGIAIGDFWILRPGDNDSKFIYNLVNSEAFMRVANVSSGSKMPRADWNLVSSTSFLLPQDKVEQEAIGKYFTSLDAQISASTSRLASLKQMKAASLQAMFPQEGETVPKVRFKGFEGEWDKQSASDLFLSIDERNRPELPVLSACQDIRGMIPREKIGFNVSHDTSNEVTYKRVKPGQFVIHLRSFQGGFAHSSYDGILSPAYTVFDFKDKERHDDYYWKIVFMSRAFIDRLRLITYGIRDGRSINFDEFKDLSFLFPSKEEQHAIATFFRSLDRQIALYTQRLEKLKQIKAACLDKMFV